MKTLIDQLSNYAAYHRSRRNILTHLVGIPMIVLAIVALLSRPAWIAGDISVSPAVVVAAVTLLYYLRLDVGLGLVMTSLFSLALWFGAWAAGQDTTIWLGVGVGGFLFGWVFQFIGHYFEGRKPAFVDDLMGLVIGPLFVAAEALFLLGAFAQLKAQIEQRVGSVRA